MRLAIAIALASASVAGLGATSLAAVSPSPRPEAAPSERKAKIRLSRAAARPGARVRLAGWRFPPAARVTVRFGGKRLLAARTRRTGGFRRTFRVPRRRPGVYTVTARAGRRLARARFRIPASLASGPAGAAPSSTTTSQGDGTAAPSIAPAATYQNPVYGFSFPDPGALRNGGNDYYAYSTGSGFPVLHSTDLVSWEKLGTALTSRPSWVVQTGDSHPWAPSVLRSSRSCPGTTSAGCYFLYYVGLSGQHTPTTHCVAVATSATPAGPYSDLGPIQALDGELDGAGRPPGCGDDAGYSNIDPAPFVDGDGRPYLYLSTNRRCEQPTTDPCPIAPTVSVIPLADDLTHAAASRKPLFSGSAGTWEQEPGQEPKVENPWMEKRGSTYYLFYSGGDYRRAYGMGYATAPAPMGGEGSTPFAKAAANPILKQTADVLSPGGGSLTEGPQGGDWLVYHGRAGDYTQPRTLRIDPVVWNGDGTVTVKGPTATPQSPTP